MAYNLPEGKTRIEVVVDDDFLADIEAYARLKHNGVRAKAVKRLLLLGLDHAYELWQQEWPAPRAVTRDAE